MQERDVKTTTHTVKGLWSALILAAGLLGACGPIDEDEAQSLMDSEAVGTSEQEALTGVSLGLVTGGIYTDNPQPLRTHADRIFCEYSNLGVKWIRIEADWPNTTAATYQLIVQKAHAKGIKVNVLVPARYCGADDQPAQIDPFIASYVSRVDWLAKNVFVGTAKADAYEIGNELNIWEPGCGDGVNRFRVGPNAFAWLLRRVWEWKAANARTELIISGGLLNTYTTESFWPAFFGSGAFTNYQGSRPFNYFGIHPYNPYHVDKTCIATGSTACFSTWKSNVTAGLKTVASRLNTATGTTGTKLFATELGFQLPTGTTCSANNCVLNQAQQAAGMQAAGDALVASAVTPYGLWYDYRDDVGERFGLRGQWNGTRYPAKTTSWTKFRTLAGGTGSTDPEACWVP
jgi:hypothetical protein